MRPRHTELRRTHSPDEWNVNTHPNWRNANLRQDISKIEIEADPDRAGNQDVVQADDLDRCIDELDRATRRTKRDGIGNRERPPSARTGLAHMGERERV